MCFRIEPEYSTFRHVQEKYHDSIVLFGRMSAIEWHRMIVSELLDEFLDLLNFVNVCSIVRSFSRSYHALIRASHCRRSGYSDSSISKNK